MTDSIDLTITIIDSLAGLPKLPMRVRVEPPVDKLPKDVKPWSPAEGRWWKRVDSLGCVHWWRDNQDGN